VTDTAETKPNGVAVAKGKAPSKGERELTTLEGIVDLLGHAFRDQGKHVEQLVKSIEAPARVASSMLKTQKAITRELRRTVKEQNRELRKMREELEKNRADAWAREQYQLEFAHKAEMRGQLIEWAKENAPKLWAQHQEHAALGSILRRVTPEQLELLKSGLQLTPEEFEAINKVRGQAPEGTENKENGNAQG
jgi:hypothetical protein